TSAQIRQQLDKTLPSKPADTWIGEDKYRTSYNVAPTRYQPVVRADPNNSNSYVVHMMRWGLVPRHTKSMPDYSSVLKSINARDDSLFMGPTGKPMFSHSKNHKRCILLAEGFYEWRRRGKERVPFYTRRRDGGLMLMAAIYDVATIQGETEPMYTYATITTNASPQLDWLHDRMPVLIPNHDHDKIRLWLDPKQTWNATLEAMLKPCDEFMEIEDKDEKGHKTTRTVYALETYQVDERVNSVRNDSPEFAQPWNSTLNKKTLNRFFLPKSETPSGVAVASEVKSKVEQDPGDSPESKDHVEDGATDVSTAVAKIAEEEVKEEMDRQQQLVSVAADDSQRDAGFDIQESTQQRAQSAVDDLRRREAENREEEEFKKVLELSRLDQTMNNAVGPSSPVVHDTRGQCSDKASPDGDFSGSADLLERRRTDQQREDEEMKRALEESLAHSHEHGRSQAVPHISEDQTLEKKEQDDMEKAIAASLADASQVSPEMSSVSALSGTPGPQSPTSSLAASSPGSKQGQTSAPTTPRKRKAGSSVATSPSTAKKNRASQSSKITSFFQPASPP
ncbi:hypothetical protein BGZ70_005034, partial [Mortierella alpina]